MKYLKSFESYTDEEGQLWLDPEEVVPGMLACFADEHVGILEVIEIRHTNDFIKDEKAWKKFIEDANNSSYTLNDRLKLADGWLTKYVDFSGNISIKWYADRGEKSINCVKVLGSERFKTSDFLKNMNSKTGIFE